MNRGTLFESRKALSGGVRRQSGIELLKLIAIFLIVLGHVVQSLHTNAESSYEIRYATTALSDLVLVLFRHFGALGNAVFFICSAWFLRQSDTCSKRKLARMLTEVWTVSVVCTAVTLVLRRGDVSKTLLAESLLPTTFSCNWYMTCYMLFYLIHPFLNRLLDRMTQKTHFRCTLLLCALYLGLCTLKADLFFCNNLLIWISIYFLVSYLRQYHPQLSDSRRANLLLLAAGSIGILALIAVTNLLGLHFSAFRGMLLRWNRNGNPLLIAIALALFQLFRRIDFRSSAVNYAASLSMLIYLIHENRMLATYFRPLLWDWLYQTQGYSHLVLWALIFAAAVFPISALAALLYRLLLQKPVHRATDFLFEKIAALYCRLEAKYLHR